MRIIRKFEEKVSPISKQKRVAAYARVSAESEKTFHSLSAQVSRYSELIQRNPEWIYVGVYADYGITGTSIKKREEFQRMLRDAEDGKIDIILTKSIQRFSRNTVDLLTTVRRLKELGIEVRFEKENISTLSGDGELMLTILASFAQEESRSISENIKWRVQKRFEQGLPYTRFPIYGYRWAGDQLVIQPSEGDVVRRIFQNFLDGKSRSEIVRELNGEGIRTLYGCKWRDYQVRTILTNITYTGDMLLNKEYSEDPITKKRRKNKGELKQYYVENSHEGIIDKDTFDCVQSEMARRRKLGPRAKKAMNVTFFTSRIQCGICGKNFVRQVQQRRGRRVGWVCTLHKKSSKLCSMRGAIPQTVLENECAAILGSHTLDEELYVQRIEKIVVPEFHQVEFHLTDGTVITRTWQSTARKECWDQFDRREQQRKRMKKYIANCNSSQYYPFSTRLRCSKCGENYQRNIDHTKSGRVAVWRCHHKANCNAFSIKEEKLKSIMAVAMKMNQFDEHVFREQVEYIEVGTKEKPTLTIHFTDGREVVFTKDGGQI